MKTIIGLDYGLRRIGIAVSDATCTLATAVGTHDTSVSGSIFAALENLIQTNDCGSIVVGLPLTADGRETEMAGKARAFATLLQKRFELPVVMVDERYSSAEADKWLAMSGRRRRDKAETDAVAAEIILQQYLDSSATETS
jgi:putative pre-16S rRNA nuclease